MYYLSYGYGCCGDYFQVGRECGKSDTYTLLGNIGAAIAVPILFPLIEVNPDVSFWGVILGYFE